MANPAFASAIEIEAETNFGENVTTFATYRIPVLGPVDCSGLKKAKIANARATQYRNSGSKFIEGPYSGSFTTRVHLFGHGSSTAGATTVSAHETWLGNVLGGTPAASAASGTTFTGGTATIPTTTASGTFTPGAIGFAGALGDGRGNGQAFVVGSHTTTNLTLLNALDAAPTNGDACRSAVMLFPNESATLTTVQSYRMRLLTSSLRYECHGVFPTGFVVGGLNAGETPYAEITWSVAWFVESVGGSFPSAVATNTANPSVIAGGSLVIEAVGTTTRTKYSARNFSIDYSQGMRTDRGPGGVVADQDIVGCRRMTDAVKVTVTIDAPAATATPGLKTLFQGGPYHALWTGSTTNGSAIAAYFPNLEPCDEYTVQRIDADTNRMTISFMAYTGATTTSELTMSCVRFAMG